MHITKDDVTGCSNRYLRRWKMNGRILLHAKVEAPLTRLQKDAAGEGFNLQVASGYRSFNRQLSLWNDKFHSHEKILKGDGQVVNMQTLLPFARIKAVMRWLALPGTSRHHWGTDFDVYDEAAVDNAYRLQLTPNEYTGSGPFAPLMDWLTQYFAAQSNTEFYRPYAVDRSGVAPEPWHISYQPVARHYQRARSLSVVKECVKNSVCAEKATIAKHLPFLFNRYIRFSES